MEIKAYTDIFVKYLLGSEGNEDILLDFINDVLTDSGFDKIKSVHISNPFNMKDFPTAKETVVDVKATDGRGRKIQVEIQAQGNESHKHRVLYYWSKAYSDQLKEGDKYSKLKPVISINLLNFDILGKYPEAHSLFYITKSDNPDLVLTDHLFIHFLELPKLVTEKELSPLDRWLYYFKYEGEGDMEIVIKDDPVIEKAHREYVKFTNDDRLREIYEGQIEYRRRYESDIEEAEIAAEKRKTEEIAKVLIAENVPNDIVIKSTGLTLEEIEDLKN